MEETTTLLSFKAGRVDFNPPSKTAYPLEAKGRITLSRYNDEETPLLSFVWEPRGPSKNDPAIKTEDFTIFPKEAEWVPVSTCSTGRAYVLKFNSSSQRIIFWMQESPDPSNSSTLTESDKKIAKRVNALLQDVHAPENDEDDAAEPTGDIEMSEGANGTSPAQDPQLVNLLRSITVPAADSVYGATNSGDASRVLNIFDVYSQNEMIAYASSLPEGHPTLACLYELLPEGVSHTRSELLDVLQSPQFSQGVDTFCTALRTGSDIGIGRIVARELGYEYKGEGMPGLIRGLAEQLRTEDSESNKADDDML
ncbi:proteasome complex subunit Rpn13 ubiquitin receptor-domain-containing protein [Dipodascopsis tothii]|uniref:proteasome complex subunit Rpn13 ubiquitin receptor-domain-containing protein n=1 Tax=Dipodascopsis tothii TaxID=44089 RepID=UPI0034CF8FA2